jgi:uncharacterized protein
MSGNWSNIMSVSLEQVYELTQQLPAEERRQLAEQLARSPAALSVKAILNTLNDHAAELSEMGVKQIGLFGSYVRQQARLDSDLDILVEMADENYSLFDLLGVQAYLEELFACKVDVVPLDSIKPAYRSEILSEVVYAQAVSNTS